MDMGLAKIVLKKILWCVRIKCKLEKWCNLFKPEIWTFVCSQNILQKYFA